MSAFRLPAYARLRRAFTVWLGRVVLKRAGITEDLSELHDLQEVDAMLEERAAQWRDDYIRQGVLMGLAEGRMEGLKERLKEELKERLKALGWRYRIFWKPVLAISLHPSFPQLRRCLMRIHCVHWRSLPIVRNRWRHLWSSSKRALPTCSKRAMSAFLLST